MTAGVFFDLGGTLFSYRNVARATMPLLVETCQRLGVDADKRAIRDAHGRAGEAASQAFADIDYYPHRDFFLFTLDQFAAALGATATAAIQTWYLEAHRQAIVDCLELKEDCLDTLDHLRRKGLYLSIVSNIDDDMLLPLIEREGLDAWFDHWTSSESAQSCKPHAGFFEHALALSGLAAAEVLFVGDSPEHDIHGANAVGMQTALIADGGMAPPLQTGRAVVTPDHTLTSLSALKTLFPL